MNICYYSPLKTTILLSNVLNNINTLSNIIVNIIVILGGILGLNYIKKMREKQIDSTFSYLTRLNVRLKYFQELLINFRDEIMDRFLPEDCRREVSADRVSLVANMIDQLSKNAKETLEFLRNEDNQIPAQEGWIDNFNSFIEFLLDCEQLDHKSYYKWTNKEEREEKCTLYFDNAASTIDTLIEMLTKRQIELEKDIFKTV